MLKGQHRAVARYVTQQTRTNRLVDHRANYHFATGGNGLKVGKGKLATQNSSKLQYRLGVSHSVEASREQRLEARRHFADFVGTARFQYPQSQFFKI